MTARDAQVPGASVSGGLVPVVALQGEVLPAYSSADPVLTDERMVAALALALHAWLRHDGPAECCTCWTSGTVLAEVAVGVRLAGWAQSTTSEDRCTCGHTFEQHREYGPMACRASVDCRCAEWVLVERTWTKTRTRVERFPS